MKRRQLLGSVAGAAALSLGGCLGSAREEYPWPTVEEDALEGWERISERTDEYDVSYRGVDALSVYERTRTYDYVELRESIAEFTDREVDRSLARFGASRMTLEGVGRRLATPERLVDDAMRGVESRFESRGIESVERVDPVEPLPDVDGEIVEYRGETVIPSFSREIDAYGVSTAIEFDGGAIDTEGVFAIWKPEADTAYLAGGMYPAEDALEALVPGAAGIDAASALGLDADPAEFRGEIVALIEATG